MNSPDYPFSLTLCSFHIPLPHAIRFLLALPALSASVLFLQRLSFHKHHGQRHNLGTTGLIYWPSFFLMLLGCIALVLRLIASSDEHLDLASKIATGSMLVSWVSSPQGKKKENSG